MSKNEEDNFLDHQLQDQAIRMVFWRSPPPEFEDTLADANALTRGAIA